MTPQKNKPFLGQPHDASDSRGPPTALGRHEGDAWHASRGSHSAQSVRHLCPPCRAHAARGNALALTRHTCATGPCGSRSRHSRVGQPHGATNRRRDQAAMMAHGLGSDAVRVRRRVLLVHLALHLVSSASAFSMPAATTAGAARMALPAPAATAGFPSFARASFNRRASSPAAPPAPWPVVVCHRRSSRAPVFNVGTCSQVSRRAPKLSPAAVWGLVLVWLKTGASRGEVARSRHVRTDERLGCPAVTRGCTRTRPWNDYGPPAEFWKSAASKILAVLTAVLLHGLTPQVSSRCGFDAGRDAVIGRLVRLHACVTTRALAGVVCGPGGHALEQRADGVASIYHQCEPE